MQVLEQSDSNLYVKTNKIIKQENPKQHKIILFVFDICYSLIIMKLAQIMQNTKAKRTSSWKFFSLMASFFAI